MFFDHGGYMLGVHLIWWVFWVVVVFAIFLVLWLAQQYLRRSSSTSPHELLKRRLAQGKIDPQEYERVKALLDRDAGKPW